MGLGSYRSIETTCFCSEGCPNGTYPFRRYWIFAAALEEPRYVLAPALYEFDEGASSPGGCLWRSLADHFAGPSVEELTKGFIGENENEKTYRWLLTLSSPDGFNTWAIDATTFKPESPPVKNEDLTSCSKLEWEIPHTTLGLAFPAFLIPALPDACDDSDWPAKQKRKPYPNW